MSRDQRGFTLIELLVALLIMAVLASVALPQFLESRTKAQDREAMTAVRTVHLALELRHQERGGFTATRAELEALEPSIRSASDLRLTTGEDSFEASVATRSGGRFTITRSADGTIARLCSNAGRGGCRADGSW